MNKKRINPIYGLPLLMLLLNISCVPLKKSIYLQGEIAKDLAEIESQYLSDKKPYVVKPNDNLYIQINSLDERTSSFLNNESGATTRIESPMSASLVGYRVESDGNINFPFVGKVYVASLTLDEVRDKIQDVVSRYIEESSVTVKLLNDNITILGEVRAPGRYLLYDEEINVIEALSLAGDATDFANKKKIRLIRREGEDHQMIVLNTLDDRLMFSPYYYLKPGDIIYVEPRRLKSVQLSSAPLTLALALINTSLLLYTFYITNFDD
ncbi:MAG: polysaccharide biosynthesis/export family protein [Carboxylicivirga sp.]|jgi:polysaccharide export outer membrane protein|nr:polysaccharide biosynthesis/export family protein [Carboxylicivirga sp.]MCT4647486.1 polysaccharide biosynthesis/export family protein [Carboxylicivirga sp.]